jgi:hypothetical protein
MSNTITIEVGPLMVTIRESSEAGYFLWRVAIISESLQKPEGQIIGSGLCSTYGIARWAAFGCAKRHANDILFAISEDIRSRKESGCYTND